MVGCIQVTGDLWEAFESEEGCIENEDGNFRWEIFGEDGKKQILVPHWVSVNCRRGWGGRWGAGARRSLGRASGSGRKEQQGSLAMLWM